MGKAGRIGVALADLVETAFLGCSRVLALASGLVGRVERSRAVQHVVGKIRSEIDTGLGKGDALALPEAA